MILNGLVKVHCAWGRNLSMRAWITHSVFFLFLFFLMFELCDRTQWIWGSKIILMDTWIVNIYIYKLSYLCVWCLLVNLQRIGVLRRRSQLKLEATATVTAATAASDKDALARIYWAKTVNKRRSFRVVYKTKLHSCVWYV